MLVYQRVFLYIINNVYTYIYIYIILYKYIYIYILSKTCNYQRWIVCFNVLKVPKPDIFEFGFEYFYIHTHTHVLKNHLRLQLSLQM